MKRSAYSTWATVDDDAYVHNGVTGAFVKVPVDAHHRLDAFLAGSDDGAGIEDSLRALVEARVLIADDSDELAVLRSRYARSRSDVSTLGFTVVTSLGCNFDCPYCFEEKHPSLLRPEVAEAILRIVDDSLPRVRSIGVTWFGGEPLLGKTQLLALSDELIRRCDAADTTYRANIITNGWYLDGATSKALAERRVERAQVTIDGPPDVHDRYRPKVGGGSTFWRIVDNLHAAVEHLRVNVRVNVEPANFVRIEELFEILAAEGLAGKISIGTGRLYACSTNAASPSASYGEGFTPAQYAKAELDVLALAQRYGFGQGGLPTPTGTPCTAVRSTEIVVGSEGELWKCWDDVGNAAATIGTIFDVAADAKAVNERLTPWLEFDPFSDADCTSCIALPGCMGGCAHRGLHSPNREDQCGTFRYEHVEKVRRAATMAAGHGAVTATPLLDALRAAGLGSAGGGSAGVGSPLGVAAAGPVPVAIRPKTAVA